MKISYACLAMWLMARVVSAAELHVTIDDQEVTFQYTKLAHTVVAEDREKGSRKGAMECYFLGSSARCRHF